MDALDVHVKKRIRIEHDSHALPDEFRQRDFVRPPVRGVTFLERRIAGDGGNLLQHHRIVEQPVAGRPRSGATSTPDLLP